MKLRVALVIVVCVGLIAAARSRSAATPIAAASARALRVCADPNNLPFSNRALQGFENRLADIVARELHAHVEYTWWAQRRGYVRNTIQAGLCDVLMGVPAGFERTLVTEPYYRSSYVFLSRRDAGLHLTSFDDPALRRLRVGVQLVGTDGQNTPPAHALADRGVVSNLVGYTLYGNYVDPNPPARIVEAVARRDVDVAVVWGPLAGYFASRQSAPLSLEPVTPQIDRNGMPLAFDIGVGVSRLHPQLRDEIDRVLRRKRAEIGRVLDDFGIPRVARPAAGGEHGG